MEGAPRAVEVDNESASLQKSVRREPSMLCEKSANFDWTTWRRGCRDR